MSDGASRQLEMNLDAPAADEAAVDPFTQELIDQLKTVFDPEIPVDIYELGLIYKIDVADNKDVSIDMTLTAPACPVAGEMPGWVKEAVARVPGVGEVTVNMV
ncbi:MAG: iron-sulfur cluster assembly protein, partial [Alphaproteobacteria bacterium]